MDDGEECLESSVEFDDSLFKVAAGHEHQKNLDTQRAALKQMYKTLFDALNDAKDLGEHGSALQDVKVRDGEWNPDPSCTNAFVMQIHLCFGDTVIVGYDNSTGIPYKKEQKGSDAYKDKFKLISLYLRLCPAVYKAKFAGKMPPADWSSGEKNPPFAQIMFILSCVTRLHWCKFYGWANDKRYVVEAGKTHATPSQHMPPQYMLDRYMVDSAPVRLQITAMSPTIYTMDEYGELVSDDAVHRMFEEPKLNVLLARLSQAFPDQSIVCALRSSRDCGQRSSRVRSSRK